MKNELESALGKFGVTFEDGSGMLADFNKVSKKKYASYNEAMRNDGDNFKNFIRKKRPSASYIGIGTLEIGYNPSKDSTGDFRCGLNAGTISIIPLKTNAKLPGGSLKTNAEKRCDRIVRYSLSGLVKYVRKSFIIKKAPYSHFGFLRTFSLISLNILFL